MKKLITLCFLFVGCFLVQGQSIKDNINWLKDQKKNIDNISANGITDGKLELTDSFIKIFSKKNVKNEEQLIYWNQIEKINCILFSADRCTITITRHEINENDYRNWISISYNGNYKVMLDKLSNMTKLNGKKIEVTLVDYKN